MQRDDAQDVVETLKAFVRKRFHGFKENAIWDPDTSELREIFTGDLEVFKNEIYLRHKIEGIAYNLDLSNFYVRGGKIPSNIVLDRFLVQQSPADKTGVRVFSHGTIDLNLVSGTLKIDLNQDQVVNVHADPETSPASSPVSATTSEALATEEEVGGIDLTLDGLNLQIKRDNNGVPLPVNLQPIETMHIDGFVPVIINITPVISLPLLSAVLHDSAPAQEADQQEQYQPAPMAYWDKKRISLN
jgi:hypothetical protein